MKWKSPLIMLLVVQLSIAQLTVRSSNYVFVEDVVFFVEDDVNLKSGSSYLYLRDEAQLVQGTGTTGNSGMGKLSVYQEGTVDQYAYNYWCSPVGNTDADNSKNRDFRPNNNIYDVTSAPISSSLATYTTGHDGSSSPLIISSFWLYTFDPGTAYSEWDHIGDSGIVAPGYGFTMKGTSGSSNNQRYDFRGKPNTGEIKTSVLSNEWTLIGNPYPSAIDAAEFIHDSYNSDFTGTLYYWEQDLTPASHYIYDYVGGYASYTTTAPDSMDNTVDSYTPATFTTFDGSGTPVNLPPPGAMGSKTAKRYIPIGQGFMIEGNTSGDVRVAHDHRDFEKESESGSYFFGHEHSNQNDLQRNYDDNGLSIVPEGYKRFRINIDFNDTYTRQLLMNFHQTATMGFDRGLEAKHPDVLNSDAHWIIDEDAYVIQALTFDQTLRIPLTVTVDQQQLIRFRIFDIQQFEQTQPIYLHDLESDIYVDLKQQNHEINLDAGTYTDRFEITFEMEALSTEEAELSDFLVFQDNANAALTIKNPNSLNVTQVTLFDVAGKQLFNETDLPIAEAYTFPTRNISDGVYLAQVVIDRTRTINKKVIVKN